MDKKIIESIILELEGIVSEARALETYHKELLSRVHPKWKESAHNLIHYRTLRKHDIRKIQSALSMLGMSRLAKAEGHILPSIRATIEILNKFIQPAPLDFNNIPYKAIERGNQLLHEHIHDLLGRQNDDREVKIMVTQPSESALNKELVVNMVNAGMDCARINCAHDTSDTWSKIIQNLKEVSNERGKHLKISMDLAGPKIRTGQIQLGPEVLCFKTRKNSKGEVIQNANITLVSNHDLTTLQKGELPVGQSFINQLTIGQEIKMVDARFKKRNLRVTAVEGDIALIECRKNVYFSTGSILKLTKKKEEVTTRVGKLNALEQSIKLNIGDTLMLTQAPSPGKAATYDADGYLVQPAFISCTAPEVFNDLKVEEKILFDDGKIEGIIQAILPDEIVIKITHTPPNGADLKSDKGINLPQSNLKISGLTAKDMNDLDFVCKHADLVNLSFVNRPSDVEVLLHELKKRNNSQIGIILKIETALGYNQLTDIILSAMQHYPLGVMIARGDLAIECGWKNLDRIQEEILSICHAAHIPLVWATQVLENLAKKGTPTRAELTDATMAQRTECVMLNKGPTITEAITMLAEILTDMHSYQNKKATLLPPIVKAK